MKSINKISIAIFLSIVFLMNTVLCTAQSNKGKFQLEITKAKFGVNIGPYRGRTAQTSGPFDQGISGFGQIYFPFQWSIDYQHNYSDSFSIKNEYNNRLFLIRPSAVFHYVDNGSMAFGCGFQFSFLITHQIYLE